MTDSKEKFLTITYLALESSAADIDLKLSKLLSSGVNIGYICLNTYNNRPLHTHYAMSHLSNHRRLISLNVIGDF